MTIEITPSESPVLLDWILQDDEGEALDLHSIVNVSIYFSGTRGSFSMGSELVGSIGTEEELAWSSRAVGTLMIADEGSVAPNACSDAVLDIHAGTSHTWSGDSAYVVSEDDAVTVIPEWWLASNLTVAEGDPDGYVVCMSQVPEEVTSPSDSVWISYRRLGFKEQRVKRLAPGTFGVYIIPAKLYRGPGTYWVEVTVVEAAGESPERVYFSFRMVEDGSSSVRRVNWDDGSWVRHFNEIPPQFYQEPDQDLENLHTEVIIPTIARGFWEMQKRVDSWIMLHDPSRAPKPILPIIAEGFGWKVRTEDAGLWRAQVKSMPGIWRKKGTVDGLREVLSVCGMTLNRYREYDQVRSSMFQTDHFFFTERLSEDAVVVDEDLPADVPVWGERRDEAGRRLLYNPIFELSKSPEWSRLSIEASPDLSAVKLEVRGLRSRKWQVISSSMASPLPDPSDTAAWGRRFRLDALGILGPNFPIFDFSDLAEVRITYPILIEAARDSHPDDSMERYRGWDQTKGSGSYVLDIDDDLWPSAILGWDATDGLESTVEWAREDEVSSPILSSAYNPDLMELLVDEEANGPGTVILGEQEIKSPFFLHMERSSTVEVKPTDSDVDKVVTFSVGSWNASRTVEINPADGDSETWSLHRTSDDILIPPVGSWRLVESRIWMMTSEKPQASSLLDSTTHQLRRGTYTLFYDLDDGLFLGLLLIDGSYSALAGSRVSMALPFKVLTMETSGYPLRHHRGSLVCEWDSLGELTIQSAFDESPYTSDPESQPRNLLSFEPLCDWEAVSDSYMEDFSSDIEDDGTAEVTVKLSSGFSIDLDGISEVEPSVAEAARSIVEAEAGFYSDVQLDSIPWYSMVASLKDEHGHVVAVFATYSTDPSDPSASEYGYYARMGAETVVDSEIALSGCPLRWAQVGRDLTITFEPTEAFASLTGLTGGSVSFWLVASTDPVSTVEEGVDHGLTSEWSVIVRPFGKAETRYPGAGIGSPIRWFKRPLGGTTYDYKLGWDETVAPRPDRSSVIRFAYPMRHAFRIRTAWSSVSRTGRSGTLGGGQDGQEWVLTRWDRWMHVSRRGSPLLRTKVDVDLNDLVLDMTADSLADVKEHGFFQLGLGMFHHILSVDFTEMDEVDRPRSSGFSPVGDDRYRVSMLDRTTSKSADVSLWSSPTLFSYVLGSESELESLELSIPDPENGDVVSLTWIRALSDYHDDLVDAVSIGAPPPAVATLAEIADDQAWLEAYVLSLPRADSSDVRDLVSYAEWEKQLRSTGFALTVPAPRPDQNTRIMPADDPIKDALCPGGAWPSKVVFGHVRTEVPYGRATYGSEEYDGSVIPSEEPCDIDASFVEPCACCPSTQVGLDITLNSSDGMVEELEALEIVSEMLPAGVSLARVAFDRSFEASVEAVADLSIGVEVYFVEAPIAAHHPHPDSLEDLGFVIMGSDLAPHSRGSRFQETEYEVHMSLGSSRWVVEIPDLYSMSESKLHGGPVTKVTTVLTTRTGLEDALGEEIPDEKIKGAETDGTVDWDRTIVLVDGTRWELERGRGSRNFGKPYYATSGSYPSGSEVSGAWEIHNKVWEATGDLEESDLVSITTAGFSWSDVPLREGDTVYLYVAGESVRTAELVSIAAEDTIIVRPLTPAPPDPESWATLGSASIAIAVQDSRDNFRELIPKQPSWTWTAERRVASESLLSSVFSITTDEPRAFVVAHTSLPSWVDFTVEHVPSLTWAVDDAHLSLVAQGDFVWWDDDEADSARVISVSTDEIIVVPTSGTQPVGSDVTGAVVRQVASGTSGRIVRTGEEIVVSDPDSGSLSDLLDFDSDSDFEDATLETIFRMDFGSAFKTLSPSSIEVSTGDGPDAVVVPTARFDLGFEVRAVTDIGGSQLAVSFRNIEFSSADDVGLWLVDAYLEEGSQVASVATVYSSNDTLVISSVGWTDPPEVGDILAMSETDPATAVSIPAVAVVATRVVDPISWSGSITDQPTGDLDTTWEGEERGLGARGDQVSPTGSLSKLEALDTEDDGTLTRDIGASTTSAADLEIRLSYLDGIWEYKNVSGSTITLPITSSDGKTRVLDGETFTSGTWVTEVVSGIIAQSRVDPSGASELITLE